MKKILLVDDDFHLAKLTKMALTKSGYEVVVLNEGVNILEDARKYKPDLILMDFMLPQISGGDAVKLLRSDADLIKIPVIFLTALISEDDEQLAGVNVDGTNYPSLGKPYEIDHLLMIVKDNLDNIKR